MAVPAPLFTADEPGALLRELLALGRNDPELTPKAAGKVQQAVADRFTQLRPKRSQPVRRVK